MFYNMNEMDENELIKKLKILRQAFEKFGVSKKKSC